MQIGAQLYTLREACRTPEGLAETLQRVAEIGYRTVQVSGTCPYEGSWLKEQLDRAGLRCVLTHVPVPRLTGEPEKVIREHGLFGCRYAGLGYWAFDPEKDMGWEKWLELFPPVAEKLHAAGMYFMYHHHDREFIREDGRTWMDRLAEAVPADRMGFTVDTYWVQVGGGDPAAWLERLSGRIPCIHLKDCGYGQSMAVLGEGNINFDRVFEKAEAGGTEYMLVEQDDCRGEDPLECLRRSFLYLKARGFS